MKKTSVNAPDAPSTSGGYVQAVSAEGVSDMLTISGQIPVSADGAVPTGFREQADLVWRNLDAQLNAAGFAKDDLVKATIFLSSRDYILENREARNAYLGDREIALTVIICGIFDEAWLLEIEATAMR